MGSARAVAWGSVMMVLTERHSHLPYLRGAAEARAVVARPFNDPANGWLEVSVDLVRDAIGGWLGRIADQRISLVAVVRSEVVRCETLIHAFAFDRDFEDAGYALVR